MYGCVYIIYELTWCCLSVFGSVLQLRGELAAPAAAEHLHFGASEHLKSTKRMMKMPFERLLEMLL